MTNLKQKLKISVLGALVSMLAVFGLQAGRHDDRWSTSSKVGLAVGAAAAGAVAGAYLWQRHSDTVRRACSHAFVAAVAAGWLVYQWATAVPGNLVIWRQPATEATESLAADSAPVLDPNIGINDIVAGQPLSPTTAAALGLINEPLPAAAPAPAAPVSTVPVAAPAPRETRLTAVVAPIPVRATPARPAIPTVPVSTVPAPVTAGAASVAVPVSLSTRLSATEQVATNTELFKACRLASKIGQPLVSSASTATTDAKSGGARAGSETVKFSGARALPGMVKSGEAKAGAAVGKGTAKVEATKAVTFLIDSDFVLTQIRAAIRAGADVNAINSLGYTPLMLAIENHATPAIIQELIDAGAQVSRANAQGQTAFHSLMGRPVELVVAALQIFKIALTLELPSPADRRLFITQNLQNGRTLIDYAISEYNQDGHGSEIGSDRDRVIAALRACFVEAV